VQQHLTRPNPTHRSRGGWAILIIAALVGFTGAFCFLAGGKQNAPKEQIMTLQPPLDGLTDYQPSERTRLVFALAELRKEWQAAVMGANLLEVKTPVGLLFNDIANRLQLSPQERHVLLGSELMNDVESFLETRPVRKLPN